MPRLTSACLIVVSFLGSFVGHVAARGRSFPIEVTGTIAMFDPANQTFAIQVDEPARILTIAIGRDCNFVQGGAPAGEQILQRGAQVRVSYFATIFTGNIAVKIESNPLPEVIIGIIKKIELSDRILIIWIGGQQRHLIFRWAPNARFFKAGKRASVTDLRKNIVVRLSYYSPAFASKYATKIELEPRF